MDAKVSRVMFVAAAMLTGCTSPTSPLQLPRRASTEPVILSARIAGPVALAPGESAQFRVIADLSDGTSRDVTTEVNWSTVGDDRQLSISAQGVVTARQTGDGYIAAAFDTFRTVREVIVVPRGTYRLAGSISEVGHQGMLAALIEVIPRSGPALMTRSNSSGAYRVYGVAGEIEFRVTAEGYRTIARTLNVMNHQSYDVELYPQ